MSLSDPKIPYFCTHSPYPYKLFPWARQCEHLTTCRCLPFTWLVVTWLLVMPQPLDAPPPFNMPSGCRAASCYATLSIAPTGCSITS